MKIIARILLFVFISFLLTPTVVCFLDESDEVSIASNYSEDEQTNKEIKVVLYSEIVFEIIPIMESASSLILFENLSKIDQVITPLYTTPPDLS